MPAETAAHGRDPRMDVIAMIYRLQGALRSTFAGPAADTKLVLLEALALGAIADNPQPPTVSAVGRMLGFSRQSVQRAVNKLATLGLVAAEPNPRHKKAPIFVATPQGRARMEAVQEKSKLLADTLVDRFDDGRSLALLDELTDLLAAIRDQSGLRDDD